jgi:hypothetical protein
MGSMSSPNQSDCFCGIVTHGLVNKERQAFFYGLHRWGEVIVTPSVQNHHGVNVFHGGFYGIGNYVDSSFSRFRSGLFHIRTPETCSPHSISRYVTIKDRGIIFCMCTIAADNSNTDHCY